MRPGQHRRKRGDALHTRIEVGELVHFAAARLPQIDVRDPVPGGDEGQRLAVGRPLRAHVPRHAERFRHLDTARGQIEERDAEIAPLELAEVGVRSAVGHERDRFPVGGPGRVQLRRLVVGEPPEILPVGVDHVEIGKTALEPAEDDLLPVRTPRGRARPGERQADRAHLLVPVDIDNHDVVLAGALRRDGQELPVRRPARGGVDEAEGLVVAAERRLEKPADDLTGVAIGQIQVDEVEVFLAQIGDSRPVR